MGSSLVVRASEYLRTSRRPTARIRPAQGLGKGCGVAVLELLDERRGSGLVRRDRSSPALSSP